MYGIGLALVFVACFAVAFSHQVRESGCRRLGLGGRLANSFLNQVDATDSLLFVDKTQHATHSMVIGT